MLANFQSRGGVFLRNLFKIDNDSIPQKLPFILHSKTVLFSYRMPPFYLKSNEALPLLNKMIAGTISKDFILFLKNSFK
jgi:hypothetical protein